MRLRNSGLAALILGSVISLYAVPAMAFGFHGFTGGGYVHHDHGLSFERSGDDGVTRSVFQSKLAWTSAVEKVVFDVLSGTVEDLFAMKIDDVAVLDLATFKVRHGGGMHGVKSLFRYGRARMYGRPQAAIPEPSAALVFAIGTLFAGGAIRRRH